MRRMRENKGLCWAMQITRFVLRKLSRSDFWELYLMIETFPFFGTKALN